MRRKTGGRVQVWIPRSRRRFSRRKPKIVATGGYWRPLRRGTKKIVSGTPQRLFGVRDEYGQFRGWSRRR